jgi:hypothetical protein
MKNPGPRPGLAVAVLLALSGIATASADPPDAPGGDSRPAEAHAALTDLGLGNFFSAGWDEDWAHRHRFTPDMALLRVTTNFLEREFRLDVSRTDVRGNATVDTQTLANGLIAYGLSRRLMIEVVANYQWNQQDGGTTASGAGGGAILRAQLVDTATLSADFQVKVGFPNKGVGQTQTSVAYAVGAWQDLHALIPALGRTGLYESIQYESLPGPARAGARTKDLAGDLSLATTWTSPDTKGFRNFTTFVEFFATRDLDGFASGTTIASVTPGIRTWFAPKHSITIGEDFPLGRPGGFTRVLRVTYIMNF